MNPHELDIITRLARGETVVNREGGNSMLPRIESRQPVTIEPVDPTRLEPRDIVYTRVNGRFYTHLVLAVDVGKGRVQIGNNKGGVNGWTPYDHVYGIITAIDGTPVEAARAKVRRPA